MERFKELTIFIVPYLLACSSLYHIVYWANFGLNGLELVSFQDIIKTSIYPLYANRLIFLVFALYLMLNWPKLDKSDSSSKITIGVLVALWIILSIVITLKEEWLGLLPITALFPATLFCDRKIVWFGEYSRRRAYVFIYVVVSIPMCCYITARWDSRRIKNNEAFKFVYDLKIDGKSNTYKYLGQTDETIIISDFANTNIFFVKKDLGVIKLKSFGKDPSRLSIF